MWKTVAFRLPQSDKRTKHRTCITLRASPSFCVWSILQLRATGDWACCSGYTPRRFQQPEDIDLLDTQRETADRYAQWTKHKVGISGIIMMQIAVLDSLIYGHNLWHNETPSGEWEQLVYHSRRGKD